MPRVLRLPGNAECVLELGDAWPPIIMACHATAGRIAPLGFFSRENLLVSPVEKPWSAFAHDPALRHDPQLRTDNKTMTAYLNPGRF